MNNSIFLRAIPLPLRNLSVNAWNLATYWSFFFDDKQFCPVLAPENFPNLIPFFPENSPYFSAEGFTLRSRPQHFSTFVSLASPSQIAVRFCTLQRHNSQPARHKLPKPRIAHHLVGIGCAAALLPLFFASSRSSILRSSVEIRRLGDRRFFGIPW
jgi:hypothetical protein